MKERLPMAVIPAGGRGMRLRPLTNELPKPLLPVGRKPILRHILENLEEEGVDRALILTGYKGDLIEETIGHSVGGLQIEYLRETVPLGSAGCVKSAEGRLEERFFVVCGDAYGKRDYKGFFRQHIEKGSKASLLLYRVEDPGEYGLVETAEDGRILGFVEKPFWSQVFSNKANTGIYLLERELLEKIPSGIPYDFGASFFPLLQKEGIPLYGFEDGGFWCDVGDRRAYLFCNLKENGGESLVGDRCLLAEGVRPEDSLLFDGVQVGRGSRIRSSVLMEDCRIGENCLLEDCLLGSGCVLPSGTEAKGKVLFGRSDTEAPDEQAGAKAFSVDPKGFFCSTVLHLPENVPGEFSFSLGMAFGEAYPKGTLYGIMNDGSAPAKEVAEHLLAGLCRNACGVDFSSGYSGKMGFLIREETAKGGAFVSGMATGGISVALFDENGLPPGAAVLRRIRDRFREEKEQDRLPSAFAPEDRGNRVAKKYELSVETLLPSLDGRDIGVGWGSAPEALAGRLLLKKGAKLVSYGKGQYNLRFSPDGRRGQLWDETGILDFYHLAALLFKEELEAIPPRTHPLLALPFRAPRILFEMAKSAGHPAVGFAYTPSGEGVDDARREGGGRFYLFDGVRAALQGLGLLLQKGLSCAGALEALPSFTVLESTFDCAPKEKLNCLLSKDLAPFGEGMGRAERGGFVRLRADERRGLHLMVEAAADADARLLLQKAKKELEARKRSSLE